MKHNSAIYSLITVLAAVCYAEVLEIQNPQQFQEIIQNNSHVVADFYAPWCQPCLRMAPFLDSVSRENDNVIFVKLSHSNDMVRSALFSQYNVHAFPTIILFRNGQPSQVIQGTKTAAQLRRIVERLLTGN